MVVRRMPRIQEVVLPLLRDGLPGVSVGSWVGDVLDRQFPLINVRRLGGLPLDIDFLDKPVIEVTAYSDVNLMDAENTLLDARQVLWDAWKNQTLTAKGYIHSYFETLGPTQFDSPYDDTWRFQLLTQIGLRPLRS